MKEVLQSLKINQEFRYADQFLINNDPNVNKNDNLLLHQNFRQGPKSRQDNFNKKYQGFIKQNTYKQYFKDDFNDGMYTDSKIQQLKIANLLPDQEQQYNIKKAISNHVQKYLNRQERFLKKDTYKIYSQLRKKSKEQKDNVQFILNKYKNLVRTIEKSGIADDELQNSLKQVKNGNIEQKLPQLNQKHLSNEKKIHKKTSTREQLISEQLKLLSQEFKKEKDYRIRHGNKRNQNIFVDIKKLNQQKLSTPNKKLLHSFSQQNVLTSPIQIIQTQKKLLQKRQNQEYEIPVFFSKKYELMNLQKNKQQKQRSSNHSFELKKNLSFILTSNPQQYQMQQDSQDFSNTQKQSKKFETQISLEDPIQYQQSNQQNSERGQQKSPDIQTSQQEPQTQQLNVQSNEKQKQNKQIKKLKPKFRFNNNSPEKNKLEKSFIKKYQLYKEFMYRINFSNSIFVTLKDPNQNQPNTQYYRYYVGRGNNGLIIKTILKKRWWWTQSDNLQDDNINFIWTQLKQPKFFQRQKQISQQSNLQSVQEQCNCTDNQNNFTDNENNLNDSQSEELRTCESDVDHRIKANID